MSKSNKTYLGFDLGSSSGRAVLGSLDGYKFRIEEISRFGNAPVVLNGTLYWDVLSLWKNMLNSLCLCAQQGRARLDGIGIDTWGVDFCLLGKDGKLLGNPICYRDSIAKKMDDVVRSTIGTEKIYRLTGLAPARVSTLSQLVGLSRSASSSRLRQAQTLLMMPDFFRYLLSGDKAVELTAAGSSQLANIRSGNWCSEVFTKFRLPKRIMPEIIKPANVVGKLRKELSASTGLARSPIVAVASHDTCSAAAAVPFVDDETAFISSGTWSVAGVIQDHPITSSKALKCGFVNEFGLDSILFVKNLMGLYLFENLRRSLLSQGHKVTYSKMIDAASQAKPFGRFLDLNSPLFFTAEEPISSAKQFLADTGQKGGRGWAQVGRALLEGLAFSYRQTLDDLQKITGQRLKRLCIVGGGSRNKLLCQMTADATGLEVIAGPAEATAAGNLASQALATGQLRHSTQVHELIRNSFRLKRYKPRSTDEWDRKFALYTEIKEILKNPN